MPTSEGRFVGILISSTSVASEVAGGIPLSAMVEYSTTLCVLREYEAVWKAPTEATARESIKVTRILANQCNRLALLIEKDEKIQVQYFLNLVTCWWKERS